MNILLGGFDETGFYGVLLSYVFVHGALLRPWFFSRRFKETYFLFQNVLMSRFFKHQRHIYTKGINRITSMLWRIQGGDGIPQKRNFYLHGPSNPKHIRTIPRTWINPHLPLIHLESVNNNFSDNLYNTALLLTPLFQYTLSLIIKWLLIQNFELIWTSPRIIQVYSSFKKKKKLE